MYRSRIVALTFLGAAAACWPAGAREVQAQPAGFASLEQFLVDKETDLAAIVKIRRVESRWVILPDGDHVPLLAAECEMEQVLSGSRSWPAGSVQSVVQYDYTDFIFEPIAPPAIEGRRYILWAFVTPKEGEVPRVAPWTAHPQGFLLVRGQSGREFVFWSGKSYGLTQLREALKTGRRLPLDQIVDPVRRLSVAKGRIERGDLGDKPAFIQGLILNVLDPEGQAKKVQRSPNDNTSTDMFGMSAGEAKPHAIWYESLALLRDLGKDERYRKDVVAALRPIARSARPRIRLAAALALVALGSDSGKEALIQGFNTESGDISSDPPDQMTLPGRYPYDNSSVTASAHALARLGDRRGLAHSKPEVRLATAEALKDKPDPELRKTLEDLARELEPRVRTLKVSGELTKPRHPGDYTNRYPEDWVRTRRLLARLGDDQSLRQLVEAYLIDAPTYPQQETPLVPRGQPSSWSSGPSPAQAIHGADSNSSHLLRRLQKLFGKDARWDSPVFKSLRESLQQPSGEKPNKPVQQKPSEAEITKLLSDSDASRRAEGLAAAGYYQISAFYDKVVDVALHGEGVERQAAIYALGFYGRDLTPAALRQLMTSKDEQVRFSAFELATRKDPARFARESMDMVRALVRQTRDAKSQEDDHRRNMSYLPRILCRLARGPLPAPLLDGLKDPNPEVRRIVILALELGGNPDATKNLEPLTHDPNTATWEASRAALRSLGPSDR
jgi:HEAT repeat protein